MTTERSFSVMARRWIPASAQLLFDAWTQPAELMQWWGPTGVKCTDARIDLRVGGTYLIDNLMPDGRLVRIVGDFEVVEPPRRLSYSWRVEPGEETPERVTVRFEPCDGGTEVVVIHERIASTSTRDRHEQGWQGCLEGLSRYVIAN